MQSVPRTNSRYNVIEPADENRERPSVHKITPRT